MKQEVKNSKKRGQVTIFIIIAIIIVAAGVLVYFLFPQVKTGFGSTENPSDFIQNCMESKLKETLQTLSLQGGSYNPKNYFLYKDHKLEYLCYTTEYYTPCVVQQPLLKQHIENEIKLAIKKESDSCFNSLRDNFESKGYIVKMQEGKTNVDLSPNVVTVSYEKELSLTRDNIDNYKKIDIKVSNNIYELMSIANSIISMEVRYGDSETTVYMNFYHDLKVEKYKQTDGTTVYILANRNTGDKFQFASRSIAWPPGITN